MTSEYQILESPADGTGFEPYGAALDYWRFKGPECMLSGPAETGKTRVGLEKLDAQMWKYPGAQAVIVRKVRGSIGPTVMQTYMKKVLRPNSPVKPYGGQNPDWFDYPNGSRIWLGGMDDPGKALSSERDIIYCNQSEELDIEDWETLLTRATGRAGNMPHAQVCGDCNPWNPQHWIKQREKMGKLKMFESRHEDNPTLFDQTTHQLTEQGVRTMSVLDGLTGVRYQRLRKGLWVAAEGTVYDEWDSGIHVVDAFVPPKDWRRIRVVDFGYTNPFVCHWYAISPDGHMYLYREMYATKRIVQEWAPLINKASIGEDIEATIADHDAEDRATLYAQGISTIPAMKDITSGIQGVQHRLRKRPDGKAGLMVMRGCLVTPDPLLLEAKKPTCLLDEVESYVWPKGQDGKPLKEVPVKENDHACDTLRYAIAYIDNVGEQELPFSINNYDGLALGPTADPLAVIWNNPEAWN